MKIADISIKRPVFIIVIMITLTILGFVSYKSLALNDMPDADLPYVSVMITENGATPEEIETKITKEVEDAVQQISGVQSLTSTINSGYSQTTIEFDLGIDPSTAAQEVRDKISGIRGNLPTDINDPIVSKFDMSASAIVSIAVYGTDDNQKASDFVDNTLKNKLYSVSGVGSINVSGEDTREIHIKLDNDKMLKYGLTASTVLNSIKTDNTDQSSGKVSDGNNEISITTTSKIQKIEDFKNIVIENVKGTEVRVKDVATVEDGVEERTSQAYYNGNKAIGIDVVKQSGSNTVEVAKGVKNVVEEVKHSLPEGLSIDIVSDNSQSIEDTVDDVMKTIYEGCILAVIIVFLFLHEWESTIISAFSLLISVITTFICLKLMHFTLNTMSLMSLSLAVGLLIDDAIVVIENIIRHLHMGKRPFEAARDATSEIGFAVIATTSAVIAVFLPLAMISGMIGKYFIEFALTIVFSMAVSLFVSFTLVPMMASKMLKISDGRKSTIIGRAFVVFDKKFEYVSEKYSHLLKFLLNKRVIVLIVCGAMFFSSLLLIKSLGFNMLPTTDKGIINVKADFDSGITLDKAIEKTKKIEECIDKYPEVKYMYSTVENSSASVSITLVDKKERKDTSKVIAQKISDDLKSLSGMEVYASASSMGGFGSSKDVTYNIVGDDREKVIAFAQKIKEEMENDPQAADVGINAKTGIPEVKMAVDRDKAADLGVKSSDVASTLNTFFNYSTVSKYDGGKDRYDVKVMLKDDQRKSIEDLNGIYVSGTNNKLIPVNQVSKKVIGRTSSSLHRYNKQAEVSLSCNVKGKAAGTFQTEYLNKIKSELPDGVSLSVGGMNGTMQKSLSSFGLCALLSIVFLYLVMAAQFESFVEPMAVMFALPLAMIGAIIALFICRSELSIMALIGIVMLMGLVAKNGILLIDAAKERMENGMNRNEALVEAGFVRLRPIIMTTLAMILGMLPTAVATGAGTEMRKPMAEAVIGGLITSTILTLFVVPIAYTLLDGLKRRILKMFSKNLSPKDIHKDLELQEELKK